MPPDVNQPEEPKPRSKWLPITLFGVGTILVVAPAALVWRMKRHTRLPLNSLDAPPRRTAFGSSPTAPTHSSLKTDAPARFAFAIPDVPLASTNADLPSTSYASPKDWDDDDNWGVPPTKLDPNDKFNPALHTVRAFGIATAIVGTLAFGGIWGLKEYLGVDNMDDLSAEFRLGVMNRMPNLAEKMRNALQFGSSSEEPDPAAGGNERSPWTWDEAQDRLAAAYDKGGIEAWANVAAQEVADEAKLEMKRREELQKR